MLVAALVAPPLASSTPGVELAAGVVIAVASLPALALLGAGLTSAALGSPLVGGERRVGDGGRCSGGRGHVGDDLHVSWSGWPARAHIDSLDAAGRVLRVGVSAAVRIAPLIALGSVGWVAAPAAARDRAV